MLSQRIFSEDKKPRHRDSKTQKPRHRVSVEFWPLYPLIAIKVLLFWSRLDFLTRSICLSVSRSRIYFLFFTLRQFNSIETQENLKLFYCFDRCTIAVNKILLSLYQNYHFANKFQLGCAFTNPCRMKSGRKRWRSCIKDQ